MTSLFKLIISFQGLTKQLRRIADVLEKQSPPQAASPKPRLNRDLPNIASVRDRYLADRRSALAKGEDPEAWAIGASAKPPSFDDGF